MNEITKTASATAITYTCSKCGSKIDRYRKLASRMWFHKIVPEKFVNAWWLFHTNNLCRKRRRTK